VIFELKKYLDCCVHVAGSLATDSAVCEMGSRILQNIKKLIEKKIVNELPVQ
jgi:hypothetical protein